mmetsp:Transcript_33536/g.81041  ORF Transcript_33536/g.81041 Transcript_33536/m.81041 type:complete len:202 (+) Transcript_33536:1306-1911(+)
MAPRSRTLACSSIHACARGSQPRGRSVSPECRRSGSVVPTTTASLRSSKLNTRSRIVSTQCQALFCLQERMQARWQTPATPLCTGLRPHCSPWRAAVGQLRRWLLIPRQLQRLSWRWPRRTRCGPSRLPTRVWDSSPLTARTACQCLRQWSRDCEARMMPNGHCQSTARTTVQRGTLQVARCALCSLARGRNTRTCSTTLP